MNDGLPAAEIKQPHVRIVGKTLGEQTVDALSGHRGGFRKTGNGSRFRDDSPSKENRMCGKEHPQATTAQSAETLTASDHKYRSSIAFVVSLSCLYFSRMRSA